ncbi:MAG TPA: hypothetical protein VFG36_06505, partial [Methanoregula sp.]|nr:hypothetical protein [Methanoregula sp.]
GSSHPNYEIIKPSNFRRIPASGPLRGMAGTGIMEFSLEIVTLFFLTPLGAMTGNGSVPATVASPQGDNSRDGNTPKRKAQERFGRTGNVPQKIGALQFIENSGFSTVPFFVIQIIIL